MCTQCAHSTAEVKSLVLTKNVQFKMKLGGCHLKSQVCLFNFYFCFDNSKARFFLKIRNESRTSWSWRIVRVSSNVTEMFKEKKNIFPEEKKTFKAHLTNLKESGVHPLRHLPLLCQLRDGSQWDTGRVQKILSKRSTKL